MRNQTASAATTHAPVIVIVIVTAVFTTRYPGPGALQRELELRAIAATPGVME